MAFNIKVDTEVNVSVHVNAWMYIRVCVYAHVPVL